MPSQVAAEGHGCCSAGAVLFLQQFLLQEAYGEIKPHAQLTGWQAHTGKGGTSECVEVDQGIPHRSPGSNPSYSDALSFSLEFIHTWRTIIGDKLQSGPEIMHR